MNKITVVPQHVELLMLDRAQRIATDVRKAHHDPTVAAIQRQLVEAWAEGVQYEMQLVEETVMPYLIQKLGRARGMLSSAQGVIAGTLPKGDCTAEKIQNILEETKL